MFCARHVETAVLDGVPPFRVLTHHVLPGALPTIATGLATSSGILLGGAVVVETLFNYPGIGAVLSSAVADRDTPVIAGVTALAGAVISCVLLLSRLLAGGRELVLSALLIAVVVTGLAAVLGVIGTLRPLVGRVVERVADVLILLPAVLGIMLVSLSWPGGRLAIIVAATALGLPYAVRLAAGAAAPVAASGYVEAAAAGGERLWVLVVREVLPNMRATLLALFGLRFVEAVYVVATAGFLQVSPQPPAADWALMIRENSPGLLLNPWAVVAPSLAVGLLALCVNLAASALAPQTGRKAVTVL